MVGVVVNIITAIIFVFKGRQFDEIENDDEKT